MKKTLIQIIMIVLVILNIANIKTYAANGSFSTSKTSASLNVGETTTFTVNATGCGGKFTISSSNTSVAQVSTSSVWAEDGVSDAITITAKSAGTATITITASDVSTSGAVTEEVTGSKTIAITVKEKETSNTTSNNSNTSGETSSSTGGTTTSSASSSDKSSTTETTSKLTGVTVDGKSYKDGAKITVENSTSSVKIYGIYEGKETTYYISVNENSSDNNVNLEEGTNTVVVTDKNGGKVTLNISRLAKEVETKPNVIENNEEEQEQNEELALTTLEVEGLKLEPEFSPEIYSYTINMEEDYSNIKINAIANQEDATIKIDGTEELLEGENIVNIIVTSKDGSDIKTYQITVNKIVLSSEIISTDEKIENTTTNENDNKMMMIILGIVVVLAIIVLIIILVKNKKKTDDYNDEFSLYNYDLHTENKEKKKEYKENDSDDINEKNEKNKPRRKGKGKHA